MSSKVIYDTMPKRSLPQAAPVLYDLLTEEAEISMFSKRAGPADRTNIPLKGQPGQKATSNKAANLLQTPTKRSNSFLKGAYHGNDSRQSTWSSRSPARCPLGGLSWCVGLGLRESSTVGYRQIGFRASSLAAITTRLP